MNFASEERLLGEYRLKQLLDENSLTRVWLAEQVSVSRLVLIDELLESSQRHAFLANVRVKASVDHPLVSSVYEAVDEPGLCFYAHELLPGTSLEEREKSGFTLNTAHFARVLRRVADAHLQHEALAHATSLLEIGAIYLDEHGVVRLKNLAIAGPRTPDQSTRDITHLGMALTGLVAPGRPGATRFLTLLSWMRGEGVDQPIHWNQIRDYCEQIEQQLGDPVSSAPPAQKVERPRSKVPTALIVIATGVALLGILLLAVRLRPPVAAAAPRATLPDAVLIAEGDHPTPDGIEEPLRAFRISAHEVTIGQYAEFLETLQMLAKDNRERTFDHENQPAGKVTHLPDRWAILLAAAKSNGTWDDLPVTLDSPVVGVDWWDAAAYAEWKQARLPSQEEWFAAMKKDVATPAAIVAGDWLPVTAETGDRTPAGLIGMAGSVCEWTRRPATNPANPQGERLWVIIGGSYLKLGSNALSREWTAERDLRRPDLGFRLVFDAP
ncbi:MAG: SUMF1/EgtB/PvdO family nonheme iron enzyme [Akkermansiaceae bacterium]